MFQLLVPEFSNSSITHFSFPLFPLDFPKNFPLGTASVSQLFHCNLMFNTVLWVCLKARASVLVDLSSHCHDIHRYFLLSFLSPVGHTFWRECARVRYPFPQVMHDPGRSLSLQGVLLMENALGKYKWLPTFKSNTSPTEVFIVFKRRSCPQVSPDPCVNLEIE